MEKTFGKDYCVPVYGNEECIPGRKDQSGKEQGKMSGQKLQYTVDEKMTRREAGDVVARKMKEYQEDHPGTSLEAARLEVCREDPKLAAKYLDQPLPLEG